MIYSNHFVMCVLVNGKPLKERVDGTVSIPLGAEYTIRFKNKNSRRAMVKFTIDNENASGNGYIIPAHQDVEIKRFADRDQMFKFVELNSDEAQLEGKNGPNHDGSKGVIEAKFYLEKAYTPPPIPVYQPIPVPYPVPVWPKPHNPWNNGPYYNDPYVPRYATTYCSNSIGGVARGMSAGGDTKGIVSHDCHVGGAESMQMNFGCATPANYTPPATEALKEGVTVGGAASGQKFTTVYFDPENDYVTLKLVLRGSNEPVPQMAATSGDAEYCGNCGAKKGRKTDKFCGKCGTKL